MTAPPKKNHQTVDDKFKEKMVLEKSDCTQKNRTKQWKKKIAPWKNDSAQKKSTKQLKIKMRPYKNHIVQKNRTKQLKITAKFRDETLTFAIWTARILAVAT